MPFLSKKTRYDKSPSFGENHGLVLTPLQKIYVRDIFYGLKRLFPIQKITKQYFMAFSSKKQAMKKTQIFGQNHGLTPLEKNKFREYILMGKEACFLFRTSPNNIL